MRHDAVDEAFERVPVHGRPQGDVEALHARLLILAHPVYDFLDGTGQATPGVNFRGSVAHVEAQVHTRLQLGYISPLCSAGVAQPAK